LNKTKGDRSTANISGLNLSSFSQAHIGAQNNHVGVKLGSLQLFVKSKGAVENFGQDKFPKEEVHKIAILDLRLMNLDRNEQNILVNIVSKTVERGGKRVQGKMYKLTPIDHGLCIPDNLAVCSFDLCWLGWKQASQPFSEKSV
jgi:hypothetical protein